MTGHCHVYLSQLFMTCYKGGIPLWLDSVTFIWANCLWLVIGEEYHYDWLVIGEEYHYDWTLEAHPEGENTGSMEGKNTNTLVLKDVSRQISQLAYKQSKTYLIGPKFNAQFRKTVNLIPALYFSFVCVINTKTLVLKMWVGNSTFSL